MEKFVGDSFLSYSTGPLAADLYDRVRADVCKLFAKQPIVYDMGDGGPASRKGGHVIRIVGETVIAEKLGGKLHDMIGVAEMEILDKDTVDVQKVPNVSKYQMEYLELIDFFKDVSSQHKLKSLTYDAARENVRIEGCPSSVNAVKQVLADWLRKIAESKHSLTRSAAFVTMLKTEFASKSVMQKHMLNKIAAVWFVEKHTISVYSESIDVSRAAMDCIFTVVWESRYPADRDFDESEKKLLTSNMWKAKTNELQENFQPLQIALSKENSAIFMVGLAQHKACVMESIPEFFNLNVKRTLPFNGIPDRIQFLGKFKGRIFPNLEKTHDVHLSKVNGETGLEITGTKDNIANCARSLKKEHDAICRDIHEIEHVAMIQYVNEEEGFLDTVSSRVGCLVVPHKDDVIIPGKHDQAARICFSLTLQSKIVCEVQRANITTLTCDAIVNAANEDMEHVGGLALAIVERGMRM